MLRCECIWHINKQKGHVISPYARRFIDFFLHLRFLFFHFISFFSFFPEIDLWI